MTLEFMSSTVAVFLAGCAVMLAAVLLMLKLEDRSQPLAYASALALAILAGPPLLLFAMWLWFE